MTSACKKAGPSPTAKNTSPAPKNFSPSGSAGAPIALSPVGTCGAPSPVQATPPPTKLNPKNPSAAKPNPPQKQSAPEKSGALLDERRNFLRLFRQTEIHLNRRIHFNRLSIQQRRLVAPLAHC